MEKYNGLTVAMDEVSLDDGDQVDKSEPLYVVGIGASAGGLEAIEALFDRLPPDTGMTFVVVQHLSPDFKSLMDEIIRRHTEMPVYRVTNGQAIQRDSIYLIPAGKEMIISEGRLLLTDKDPSEMLTLPIDHFFRSLANDCGTRAIAIVLSGSGSDGSRGVVGVHAAGGMVITQDSATAGFDSMPNSSQETGCVDVIGAPSEIADALLRLANHPLQQVASEIDPPGHPRGRHQTHSPRNPGRLRNRLYVLQTGNRDAADRTSLVVESLRQPERLCRSHRQRFQRAESAL